VVREIKEVGSGLNGHRKKLASLLADTDVTTIVVEHRDRPMRFGTDYIEAAMAASGRKLIVVNDGEMKDDLVQDMIDVMTSFCARLYGRRSGRRALAGLSARESHNTCSRTRRLSLPRQAYPMTDRWIRCSARSPSWRRAAGGGIRESWGKPVFARGGQARGVRRAREAIRGVTAGEENLPVARCAWPPPCRSDPVTSQRSRWWAVVTARLP